MDPHLTPWWMFFWFALVVDVVLWILGFRIDVGPDARFRLFATAALLLYIVLGMLVGWGIAAAIWFAGLWICAIIAGSALAPESKK
jgi:hypothetical protein